MESLYLKVVHQQGPEFLKPLWIESDFCNEIISGGKTKISKEIGNFFSEIFEVYPKPDASNMAYAGAEVNWKILNKIKIRFYNK